MTDEQMSPTPEPVPLEAVVVTSVPTKGSTYIELEAPAGILFERREILTVIRTGRKRA